MTGDVLPLGADDRDDAVALWEAAGLTRPWNDPHADYARALFSPTATILGLRNGTRLVATAMVGDDGHRGWLYYLAVAPDRQRKGLGRTMMEAAEGWLRARGMPAIRLMVRGGNAAAGFYAALGYEPSDVVVMGRRLDGDRS